MRIGGRPSLVVGLGFRNIERIVNRWSIKNKKLLGISRDPEAVDVIIKQGRHRYEKQHILKNAEEC